MRRSHLHGGLLALGAAFGLAGCPGTEATAPGQVSARADTRDSEAKTGAPRESRAQDAPSSPRSKPPAAASADQVVFHDGIVTGELDPRFRFAPSPDYFASLELPERYRVDLEAIHEVEAERVYLVAIRCIVHVRGGGGGWEAEAPVEVKLRRRSPRPVHAQRGGLLEVQPLTRTLHLDQAKLLDDTQKAIDQAIRNARERK